MIQQGDVTSPVIPRGRCCQRVNTPVTPCAAPGLGAASRQAQTDCKRRSTVASIQPAVWNALGGLFGLVSAPRRRSTIASYTHAWAPRQVQRRAEHPPNLRHGASDSEDETLASPAPRRC